MFQPKQILAVCSSRTQHQGLGKLKTVVEKRTYGSLVMDCTLRKVIVFEICHPSHIGQACLCTCALPCLHVYVDVGSGSFVQVTKVAQWPIFRI